jgi:hypothetical protein
MSLKKLTQQFDSAARTFAGQRPSVPVHEDTFLGISKVFGADQAFNPTEYPDLRR